MMHTCDVYNKTPQSTMMRAGNSLTLLQTHTGEGDSLRWARICRPTEEVLVATRDGFGKQNILLRR